MIEDIIAILKSILLIIAFCFGLVSIFWVSFTYVGILGATWTGWSIGSVCFILYIVFVVAMALVGAVRILGVAARWWLGD